MPNTASDRLFSIDSVWAVFPDTSCIGQVYRGASVNVVPAYLKNGVSQAFTTNLFALYAQFQERHRPVRLRIDNLSYSEDPTQGIEIEIGLTFFKLDSLGQYRPFFRADIETEPTGIANRGIRIQNELIRAIAAMNVYLNKPALPNYFSDHEQKIAKAAFEMRLDSVRYDAVRTVEDNIVTCQHIRSGIYISAQDLIMNRPALTGPLIMEGRDAFAAIKRPNLKRARYRFFGFSDGTNCYVNSGRYGKEYARYAKVINRGRYLVWRDDYLTVEEKVNATVLGASFGLLGGLVALAAKGYRDCIAIDSQTGELLHITSDRLIKVLVDAPTLLADYGALGNPTKSDVIYDFMIRYNQLVSNR